MEPKAFPWLSESTPKPLSGYALPKTGILKTDTTTPQAATTTQAKPTRRPAQFSAFIMYRPAIPIETEAANAINLMIERSDIGVWRRLTLEFSRRRRWSAATNG